MEELDDFAAAGCRGCSSREDRHTDLEIRFGEFWSGYGCGHSQSTNYSREGTQPLNHDVPFGIRV